MSGWITGFVELPPGAIKDAEGVGECAQVFFISEAQNGSLELGIADPAGKSKSMSMSKFEIFRWLYLRTVVFLFLCGVVH